MKLELKADETHVRKIRVDIPWEKLKVFFAEYVAEQARMPKPHIPGSVNRTESPVTAKVSYHEQTEGSPSYRVGFSISVEMTQDMNLMQAEPGDGH